jgi:predicted nucleotidyltransferase
MWDYNVRGPAWELFGRSEIRRRILGLIILEPEQRLHLREIARRVGTSAGTARRELQKLEAAGIVESVREGRQVYFQVPKDSTIYRTLDEIVRQTAGAGEILRRLLSGLDGVKSAVIFGSYAAGVTSSGSDVDLLVVGRPDRDELTDRLEQAGREIGRPVNEVVYTADELEQRRARGDVFVRSIDEGRVIPVLP